MTKEKLLSLTKYLARCKELLEMTVPHKHENHPDSYKTYLRHEIKTTQSTLDAERESGLSAVPGKK